MIEALEKVLKNYMKVAPHANRIRDNKLRVYEISKDLPHEKGLELIELFENTMKEMQAIHTKLSEWKNEERK